MEIRLAWIPEVAKTNATWDAYPFRHMSGSRSVFRELKETAITAQLRQKTGGLLGGSGKQNPHIYLCKDLNDSIYVDGSGLQHTYT